MHAPYKYTLHIYLKCKRDYTNERRMGTADMEEKTPAGCTSDGRRHRGCRQLAEVLAEKIGMPRRITVECAMDGQGMIS